MLHTALVSATTSVELGSGDSVVLESNRRAWGRQLCWSHAQAQVRSCLQSFIDYWKLLYTFQKVG